MCTRTEPKVRHHMPCCVACCCLQVMCVHQSRVNFRGSPHDFLQLAQLCRADSPSSVERASASNAACR
jgi:hypothetical protein